MPGESPVGRCYYKEQITFYKNIEAPVKEGYTFVRWLNGYTKEPYDFTKVYDGSDLYFVAEYKNDADGSTLIAGE